mmetsp:Transcript_17252/g.56604  ORF Transcript_17252/g.56604 Transcript_17252/m.56604 type:complete len:234 (-) Transcript_17252:355-1056(-)
MNDRRCPHTRAFALHSIMSESRAPHALAAPRTTERERTVGQAAAAVGQRRSADLAVASVVHLVGAVKVHLAEVRVAKDAGSDAAPDRVDVVARGEHAEAAHALARLDLVRREGLELLTAREAAAHIGDEPASGDLEGVDVLRVAAVDAHLRRAIVVHVVHLGLRRRRVLRLRRVLHLRRRVLLRWRVLLRGRVLLGRARKALRHRGLRDDRLRHRGRRRGRHLKGERLALHQA